MALYAPALPLNSIVAESLRSVQREPFGSLEAPELMQAHLSPMELAIMQLLKSMRHLTGILMLMSRARAAASLPDDFGRGWGDDM